MEIYERRRVELDNTSERGLESRVHLSPGVYVPKGDRLDDMTRSTGEDLHEMSNIAGVAGLGLYPTVLRALYESVMQGSFSSTRGPWAGQSIDHPNLPRIACYGVVWSLYSIKCFGRVRSTCCLLLFHPFAEG